MATVRGIAYPLSIVGGGLKTAEDADLYAGHVRAVLETYRSERVMFPAFGIPNSTFTSYRSLAGVTERIRFALIRYVPDGSFSVRSTITDGGDLSIRITWKVRGISQPPIQYQLVGGK